MENLDFWDQDTEEKNFALLKKISKLSDPQKKVFEKVLHQLVTKGKRLTEEEIAGIITETP
jgi:hypothetical protein